MDIERVERNIRLLLGEGVIELRELGKDDVPRLIEMAYDIIKPYIADRKFITVVAARSVDLTEYKVLEPIRVLPANIIPYNINPASELMFDFQVYRTLDNRRVNTIVDNYSIMDYEIPFEFNDGILMLSPGSIIGQVTVEAIVEVPLKELKDERAMSWIQKYSLALCKERIGRIRSRFKPNNVPVDMDGEQMISEAQSEKSQLENELTSSNFGPFFITR